jgi:pyrroline-5-carboxylate reductase
MQDAYNIQTAATTLEIIDSADVIVLCVKPQVLPYVHAEIAGRVPESTLALSIMAGVQIDTLRTGLQHDRIVRSMPNTPAQVGKGVTVWTATKQVSDQQKEQTSVILGALGDEYYYADEDYLDKATGLSGSGPGFVLLMVEAMIDSAVQIGYSRPDAHKMVLQLFDGTVELVRQTGLHPVELRNRVTSPGGTTAAGLYEMEACGVRTAITRAVQKAYEKSQELGNPKENQAK